MRKANEVSKPVPIATPKQPKQEYVPPTPSMRAEFGQGGAVRLRPKMRISEAMYFAGMNHIPELIDWLGDDFYALTAGGPVSVPGLDAGKWIQSPPDAEGVKNYTLIIFDSVRSTYVVVNQGRWIMRDPDGAYSTFSNVDIRERYDFIDDVE